MLENVRKHIPQMTLRARLTLLVAALLVGITTFLASYFPSHMESLSREWGERRAKAVGAALAPALSTGLEFDDADSVGELLASLERAPEVIYAIVHRTDGAVFASWKADNYTSRLDAEVKADPVVVSEGRIMHVLAPIPISGDNGATLTIGFSLERIEKEVAANRKAVLTVSGVMLAVGLILTFLMATLLVRPVRRMTEVAQQVARGDLNVDVSPLVGKDEVGRMAAAFDSLIRGLQMLASCADEVADGDLTSDVELKGQLPDAFNRMLNAQRGLVEDMKRASNELASASAQIFAASQEQQTAATQQLAAVAEVATTMDSLLESAGHISDATQGVLANSERTASTTQQTADKVAELSKHTNRIAELLDVIRDIADRSDLLALNASLEGTRAGDAGRGFSLLAAEMRRLAERVTASVQDVQTLVDDVRAFGSTTIMATEEGRKLANSTTDSARQIALVTQQQRSATEQVTQSTGDIRNVLAQSEASSQQVRAAAEDLTAQAAKLAQTVGTYRTVDNRIDARGGNGA